jgi:hypothetical protein
MPAILVPASHQKEHDDYQMRVWRLYESRITACKDCGALVVWAKTTRSGKSILLDADPFADKERVGRFALMLLNPRQLGAAYVDAHSQSIGEPGHRPHFKTCPKKEEVRG